MKPIVSALLAFLFAGHLGAEPAPTPPIVNIPPGTKTWHARALAIKSPKPEFPAEARKRHWYGVGWFAMHVDEPSGVVTSVAMLQSTGHKVLDRACLEALRKWRFLPHSGLKIVKTPITFTNPSEAKP